MQRNKINLELYKLTCEKVLERSDGFCEVMIKEQRCFKFIGRERATWTSFLHTETRNGKADEWVLDPENVTLGCAVHHYEEERTGVRVERCGYDEIQYLPEEV